MRKFIFSTLIATLSLFSSCQKENIENSKKIIVTANISNENSTRVSLTPETVDGKTTVKVAWKESGEKIKILWATNNEFIPKIFNQIPDTNQFTGEAVEGAIGYIVGYGFYNSEDEDCIFDYDISEQNGTLSDEYTLMVSDAEMLDSNTAISFTLHHITAILKPVFKLDGESQNANISKIVLSGVSNACSPITPENSGDKITVTPSSESEDIYIFLSPKITDGKHAGYPSEHKFVFDVTIGETEYTSTLTIPNSKSIELGKFYTATLPLTPKTAE